MFSNPVLSVVEELLLVGVCVLRDRWRCERAGAMAPNKAQLFRV